VNNATVTAYNKTIFTQVQFIHTDNYNINMEIYISIYLYIDESSHETQQLHLKWELVNTKTVTGVNHSHARYYTISK